MVRLLDLAQPPKVDPCVSPEGQGWGWLVGGLYLMRLKAQGGDRDMPRVISAPLPPFQTSGACCHPSLCQDLTSALPTFPHTATGPADFKASN